ncbi:MAG TPA: cyanophycin synthetase [Solirubrobacteraceae bacterium]|nr:cyanophycin synthetase [Solirubrobacteraceae bacterium]
MSDAPDSEHGERGLQGEHGGQGARAKPRAAETGRPGAWSAERAEDHLRSLELFGMRFGLDRIRRMMTVLDSPQQRFQAVHVVGTNGKSSTTRLTAAILERHGLRTGAYLSPHLVSYTERVQVSERDLATHEFAAAIARAAWAAERVNRTLAENDHVTQFELLTAAALWALAERGVQVAVVEAGLGGRYDATSVIDSQVTALTNVGLEHVRWLGPTVRDIAAEKLAVLKPGTTLALGAQLPAEVLELARAEAARKRARIVQVRLSAESLASAAPAPLLARGVFQRRNLALARVAAAAYLDSAGIELREELVAAAGAATLVPGRLQVVAEDPLTLLDGAHNPDAVDALVESLPELLAGRPLALVLGVLDDKDAAAMLGTLLPLCARAWFTAPPSARALSPAALQSLARQLGFDDVAVEAQPQRALAAARDWAREQPGGAVVLAAGSIYLVGELLGALERSHDGAHDSVRRSG